MSTVKSKRPSKKAITCEIDERTQAFAQFTLNNGSAEANIPTCIERARKIWETRHWPDRRFQDVFELCYLEMLTRMACDHSNELINAMTAMVLIFDGLTQRRSINVYATSHQKELFGIVARFGGKCIGTSSDKAVRGYTIFHFPPFVNVKDVVETLMATDFEVVPVAEAPDQLNPNNTPASRRSDDKPVAEPVAPEAVSEAADHADSEPGDDDLPATVIKKLVSDLPAAVVKELYAVFERHYVTYKDRDYDEFEVETLDGRETGRAKRGTAEWRKAMRAWTKQRRAAYDFDKIAWYDHLTGERESWGFPTFLGEIKLDMEEILWTYVTSDLTWEDVERFDEPTPEYLDWVSEVIENCLDTLDDDFDDDTLDDDFDDSIKGYLCPETCALSEAFPSYLLKVEPATEAGIFQLDVTYPDLDFNRDEKVRAIIEKNHGEFDCSGREVDPDSRKIVGVFSDSLGASQAERGLRALGYDVMFFERRRARIRFKR